ncbi:TonB-dependent receptor domain-containing protein, partial [Phenylobacterium sp.]|uniref:TonB-dependent receptor domain-containing protein n=1 Tax=Phenylobacterium sp. TaxID=1871053 RepID=UPI0039839649
DGRRVVGANASNSVDLNTIPNGLIERVEIITGGASAVYGADAAAGVVNIILREDFEGVEAQGRTLVSERGDGREHDLGLVAGDRFGRLKVTGALGWSRREEVGKGQRSFSAQAGVISSFLPGGAYQTGANAPTQAAVDAVFARYGAPPGAVLVRGGFAGFGFNTDGTLIGTGLPGNPALDARNYRGSPDDVATVFFPDVYSYNFEPFNKLILPLERRSAALFADLGVTDRIKVYGRALGARYTAATALAPTPAPTAANPLYPGLNVFGFTIPVTNPFIPADLSSLLASRRGNTPALAGAGAGEEFLYRFRTVALGPRQSDTRADTLNLLAGARAELTGDWRLDTYASFGRYERTEIQQGLLSVRRLEQLLDSPTGGRDLCDGGFNPFGAQINEACRDFLQVRARFATRVEQDNAVATLTGPVARLPAGPVQAVAGAEFRKVRYRFAPPVGLTPGDVAGFVPLSAVAGSVRFQELFGEAVLPLLADRPWARALDVTLGYRRTQERTTGGADSYKADFGWTVVDALRIRGSYQRAVRAPDIFERFEPAVGGSAGGSDPCASGNSARTDQVLALCRRQAAALGFAAGFADGLQQFAPVVSVVQSGNPELDPEVATSFTLGAGWRPGWDSAWIGDLRATLDGYEIEIQGAIDYRDPQLMLNDCYNLGGGNSTYDAASPACGALTRSSVDFSVGAIPSPRTNQAFLRTRGIDASVSFRTDLAGVSGRGWAGTLDTQLSASRLLRFDEQGSAARPRIDYAGTISGSGFGYQSLPRWKAILDLEWTSGPIRLGVSGGYIGPMEHRLRRENPGDLARGVGAATYWDLSGGWDIGRGVEVRGGVLNLFDRQPELYTPAVDANTEPSTYDVIGRRFWLGLTLRL